jgi:hypothetical protein
MSKILGIHSIVETIQTINASNGTSGSPGSPATNWTINSDTTNGVLSAFNTGTGQWTASKKCSVTINLATIGSGVNQGPRVYVRGAQWQSITNPLAGQELFLTSEFVLNPGDTFSINGYLPLPPLPSTLNIIALAFNY